MFEKLIVVLPIAEIDGDLVPMEAMQVESKAKALAIAEKLAKTHAGVVAWSRDADPALGIYSEPTVLLKMGKVPGDLE